MRFKSIKSSCTDFIRSQEAIAAAMYQCRLGTLDLFKGIDYATFCHQPHPDFSPAGWHLGHIAYTESLWLLERGAGMPPLFPQYRQLFVADGLPKTQRVQLPPLVEILYYLDTIREKVLNYLEVNLDREERLWRWLIQHESQHSETIAFVLQLQRWGVGRAEVKRSQCVAGVPKAETGEIISAVYCHPVVATDVQKSTAKSQESAEILAPLPITDINKMIEIPAGEFDQGNECIDALDNERPVHRVNLETYWIDRYPVTCGQYQRFMEAGGYYNPNWWSNAGWAWLQHQQVTQPLYWAEHSCWTNHPVCGVSWYEAEAYARFVDKRLPTEAEWEKAASWDGENGVCRTYPWGEMALDSDHCNHDNVLSQTTPVDAYPDGQSAYGLHDTLGNVWEWTASVFQGYEGFMSYPYAGYSKVYFDEQHQILKGGSWATRPWALRCSFRNWYYPGVRQILAGFRCAKS